MDRSYQAQTLRHSWEIQLRVVGALLIRETLTRYGRHNIGFLWLFAEPMLFTLGVTALWTATKTVHGSDLPIVAFTAHASKGDEHGLKAAGFDGYIGKPVDVMTLAAEVRFWFEAPESARRSPFVWP